MDAKHLNFDDDWRPFTDADRRTPQWQDCVRHLLNDMDDWRPIVEPNAPDYYHQRCMLLYRTVAYLPPGALYDRVLATWIATFAESSLQWDDPAESYFEVSRFFNFSKKEVNGPVPPDLVIQGLARSPLSSGLPQNPKFEYRSGSVLFQFRNWKVTPPDGLALWL